MEWLWFWFAFAIANAAALAFHFSLRRGRRARTVAWLLCSGVILLSPWLIPLDARPLRFLQGVTAITLLFKLYDAYRQPGRAINLSTRQWIAYLPNWFWFVLRRVPIAQPARRDWRRVAVDGPLMVVVLACCVGLFRLNWAGVPFVIEHVVKVIAFATVMMLIGRTSATLYRRWVGPATDPIDRPFTVRTPAEFWRRWNRPFRDFFDEYVFRPAGGVRHPVRATLAVFAVSGVLHEYVFGVAVGRGEGWQMLFFMVQGCACAATLCVRPSGWRAWLWLAATLAFNLTTAVVFCRSVDGVMGFYQR